MGTGDGTRFFDFTRPGSLNPNKNGIDSASEPGVWTHFEPLRRTASKAYGSHGRNRGQRNYADLAMRALSDDGKAKRTLGKSPATFLGNFVPKPLARTSSSTGTEAPHPGGADVTRPNEGAKFKRALDIARNTEALEDAVALIKVKFFAESNKGPQARKEADVLELAEALAKGTGPFPLTPQRVVEFGAALKGADYKSGEQYLGVLRLAHLERDHPVTPALKTAFDLTRRALIRDKGKANRAPEFQIEEFGDNKNEHNLADDALAFPALTYSLAVAFMLRRCELEKLKWEDVYLAPDGTQVTLHSRSQRTTNKVRVLRGRLDVPAAHRLPPARSNASRSSKRSSSKRV